MRKFEEKTIDSEVIYDGKIIRVQIDQVELPDGNVSTREIVKHPGAVAIIALNSENKIIMVEQYRKPMDRSMLEIPAGKLEPGEDPEITAARELEEETGYQARSLNHLISFYTSPGFADEIIHLYIGTDIQKVESPLQGDEDEFVELHEITLEEALQAIADERIFDAKTVYAIQHLQLQKALNR